MCTTNRNKNKSAFRTDNKEGEEKKKKACFVTSLIIFHTLQTGVYCIGGEGGSSGYEMEVGEWMGVCCGSVFSGGPRQHSVAALWWAVQGV